MLAPSLKTVTDWPLRVAVMVCTPVVKVKATAPPLLSDVVGLLHKAKAVSHERGMA